MGNTQGGGGICVTYSPTVQEVYERGEVNMDDFIIALEGKGAEKIPDISNETMDALVDWGARTRIYWEERYIKYQKDIYKINAIYAELLGKKRPGWSWRKYCREVEVDPNTFRRYFKKAGLPLLGGAVNVDFIGGEAAASLEEEPETPEEVKEDVVAVQTAIEQGEVGPRELTGFFTTVSNAIQSDKIPPGIAQMFNMME